MRKSLWGLILPVGALGLAGVIALASAGGGASAQTGSPTPVNPSAGSPSGVPSARFFGSVTNNGAPVAQGATITVLAGTAVCGTGTATAPGQYSVDAQSVAGCTAPGASVSFTVNGAKANETSTLPPVQGTAVAQNLTVAAATPTPAPRTPVPATPAPTPAPATPAPTAAPGVATATPIVPVRPPSTGLGGLSQQKPSAPVAQVPRAAAPAQRAAAPSLPNTGTAGLKHDGGTLMTMWLILVAAGALLAGSAGLVVSRRRS